MIKISISIDQKFWQQKVILPLIMRRAYLGYLYFNRLPNDDCKTKEQPYSYQVFKDYHGEFHGRRGLCAWKYYLSFAIYLHSIGIVGIGTEFSWVQYHSKLFYVCVIFGWKWLASWVVKYKKYLWYETI